MSLGGFIFRNAVRNKRRSCLTVGSVAVSLFLFVTLQVATREMTIPPEDVGASLRIAVRNKISLANPLPARQLPTILRMPGVAAVTPFTFFGGKFKDDDSLGFAQFAVDPEKFLQLFGEAKIPSDQLEDWKHTRDSCIVGKDTAKRYGLKPGDRVTLVGTIYPVDLELKIAGIYEGTIDDTNMWFHHKYLDEAMNNWGQVGMWWLKAENAEVVPDLLRRINAAFASTSAEVRAETERAFQMSFVSMWGNISLLINSICTVVVFTLALVTASTMSMTIRERFRELAVLKTLGFRRRQLVACILAESFGLAFAGALAGVGGAAILFRSGKFSFFPVFELTPRIAGLAFLIGGLLGVISMLAPAWSVCRMSVTEGLKTLD
ncbi:MAG: FtsX-like permease family protein [Terrimicrobiaceae bacterium]